MNNSALVLASGKKVVVIQPAALTGGIDSNQMMPFVKPDSPGVVRWFNSQGDSLQVIASQYVFSLYRFKNPIEEGSWCNSDNSTYFKAYTQTKLTLIPKDDINTYKTEVFLVFKNLASMVHVYSYGTNFPYNYAPVGLQCTLVALGIKDGNRRNH